MSKEEDTLSIVGYCEKDRYLYTANYEYNCFFRLDKENKYKCEYLKTLKGFDNKYAWKIRSMYAVGNKIILVSHMEYEVAIYDVITNNIDYYKPCDYVGNIVVRDSVKIENDIYLFAGCLCNKIYKFSLESFGYTSIALDYSQVYEVINKDNVAEVMLENVCVYDNKFWRALPGTNCIINIDMDSYDVNVVKLDEFVIIYTLDFQEGKFIVVPIKSDYIAIWDPNNKKNEYIYFDYVIEDERGVRGVVLLKDRIIVIPAVYNKVMVIDYNGNVMAESRMLTKNCKNKKGAFFVSYFCDNNEIVLLPFSSYEKISYNYKDNLFKYSVFNISKEDYVKGMLDRQGYFCEKECMGISDYLQMINANCQLLYGQNENNCSLKRIMKKI